MIEPLRSARYDIEALVAGITDENRHQSVNMGGPLGVWHAGQRGPGRSGEKPRLACAQGFPQGPGQRGRVGWIAG